MVHLEVVTSAGLVVRLSFSNLFKEFKSTSTWLQFPFRTSEGEGGGAGGEGPDASPTRWTFLSLNLKEILSRYLFSNYSYLKNIKLCSNMLVKNAFTSDVEYSPLAVPVGNKHGQYLRQLPRDMSLPLAKDMEFLDVYDYICFPCAEKKLALLSEQRRQLKGMRAGSEGVVTASQLQGKGTGRANKVGRATKTGRGAKTVRGGDGRLESSDHVNKLHYHVVRDLESSGDGHDRNVVVVGGADGHVTAYSDGRLADHNVGTSGMHFDDRDSQGQVVSEGRPNASPQRQGEGEGVKPKGGGGRGVEESSSEGSVHVHAQQGTELTIHRDNQSIPERVLLKAKPTVSCDLWVQRSFFEMIISESATGPHSQAEEGHWIWGRDHASSECYDDGHVAVM